MKKEIKNPFPDGNCFFCGSNNKFGLKLKFYWDEEKKEASTEYLAAKHFTGQGNILHGAIQMGLLDEIMGWTSYVFTEKMAVTSGINVKFLKPAYIDGEKISITCKVTSKEGLKIKMHAKLFNIKGAACTEAEGSYHILSSEKYRDIIQ
ncbi:MAG: PaaI family thioesterase [Deltaproteobacteria bacterium]|jgi:acyl-coenzyme A thioesterase PaaI-like protein|nr:PaaI family thioesterase [Deltaproteobacteria bacterium]